MSSEKFCLKWNDFESNISSAFRDLKADKDFFDVTLACDEDQLSAHKVILSACSPFFKNLLRRNQHPHPLLYLKGISFTGIQSVLNFMYYGEVNIAQEDLNNFLMVAEELQVKGLTQNQRQENLNSKPAQPQSQSKSQSTTKITPVPSRSFQVEDEDEIQEVTSEPIKLEQVEGSKQEDLQVERYEDQGTYYEDYGETYGADYAMAVSDSNSTLVEKGNDIIVLLVGLTWCPLSQDCMWMTLQIC